MDSELEQRGRGLNASSESYFDDDGEGRLSKKANRPKTYTAFFENIFPQYLAIGMSYNEFWFCDCTLVKAYREAHRLRLEQENLNAWLHGLYVYEAFATIAPVLKSPFNKVRKINPYTEKPHELNTKRNMTEKEKVAKREKDDEAFFDLMNAWMTRVNESVAKRESEKEKASPVVETETEDAYPTEEKW